VRLCVWIGWFAGCSADSAVGGATIPAPPTDLSPATTTTPDGKAARPTGSVECINAVVRAFPEDGAEGVFSRTSVWFQLTSDAPDAVITIKDADGEVMYGETLVDGPRVTWVGAPLPPGAMYVATLTASCALEILEFTTSAVGAPLDVDVTGFSYAIEPTHGAWVEPASIGALLADQTDGSAMLLAVTSTRQRLDLVVARGTALEQDPCAPTTAATSSAWADPTFTLSSAMLPLTVGGNGVALDDLEVVGAFEADGSRFQLGRLTARVDTRQLADPLAGYTSADLCAEGCIPCADGVGRCLPVVIDGLEGVVTGANVATRTADQIANDIACR
jgi:hypothetical protein